MTPLPRASGVEATRTASKRFNGPSALIAVAGRAGVAFELDRAAVTIGSIALFTDGKPHDELAPAAAEYLKGKDLTVGVHLGAGSASSTVWTCDLSADYVRINADYRT